MRPSAHLPVCRRPLHAKTSWRYVPVATTMEPASTATSEALWCKEVSTVLPVPSLGYPTAGLGKQFSSWSSWLWQVTQRVLAKVGRASMLPQMASSRMRSMNLLSTASEASSPWRTADLTPMAASEWLWFHLILPSAMQLPCAGITFSWIQTQIFLPLPQVLHYLQGSGSPQWQIHR